MTQRTQRTITKALITQEDLALGQGVTNQTRQSVSQSVTQIDLPWVVTSFALLSALDTTKYKHAIVNNGSVINLYQYDVTANEVADDYSYVDPDTGSGQWVLVNALAANHSLVKTWTANQATFIVTGTDTVETANSSSTVFTNATGALRNGAKLVILVTDANTTISHLSGGAGQFSNASSSNISASSGAVYTYIANNDIWVQV